MTNPTYKPFDLQAAIAGKPIVCRNGTPAEFVAYKEDADTYKIVCFVREKLITFTKDGSFIASADDGFDLFMAPEKKKVWINTYKEWNGDVHAISYRSEQEAKHDSESDGFLETIVREYDI